MKRKDLPGTAFKERILLAAWVISFLLISGLHLRATPIRVTVRAKGLTTVDVTFGPILTNMQYGVLVRTNSPEGHWQLLDTFQNETNKTASITCDTSRIPGLNARSLTNWSFAAGRWDDPFGDELPTLYKELALRSDPSAPGEPYGNPAGDGWNNLEKLRNGWNPLAAYPPPNPHFEAKYYVGATNSRFGKAVLKWDVGAGPLPDYFVIERATRNPRPMTNRPPFSRPGFPRTGPTPVPMPNTNFAPQSTTNRPTVPLPARGAPPSRQREDPFIIGTFAEIAQVQSQALMKSYEYVDTNVDTLFQPQYRLIPHNTPPLRAYLNKLDSEHIRETLITARATPTTNGYTVTIPHPIPSARYLLLVRDKSDPQWRASGYFESDTNRSAVTLHVNRKGMMGEGQKPASLPEMRFTPDVVQPEFAAGWGEDTDGDGLPDIYEVLVTHTDPEKADTGNTGVLDGFKEPMNDGLSNLEKFRKRINPQVPAKPPAPVELKQPTRLQVMQALAVKSDVACVLTIGVKTNGSKAYQPIEKAPSLLSRILNTRGSTNRLNLDVWVSWRFATAVPVVEPFQWSPDGTQEYRAFAQLITRVNSAIVEAFAANLSTNPPVPWSEAKKIEAEIIESERAGDMDRIVAMSEFGLLRENIAQQYFGRVIDQAGSPVKGAVVKVSALREKSPGAAVEVKTDSQGNFEVGGLRGRGLTLSLAKPEYQYNGAGEGLKNVNGPETSQTNRATFVIWKLKGPEPMTYYHERFVLNADNRILTVDLLTRKQVEGTNTSGDLRFQFSSPTQTAKAAKYDWSLTLTGMGGGFIKATNTQYLNLAPKDGYEPGYSIKMTASDPAWRTSGEETLYLKSRDGEAYGSLHLRIFTNPHGEANMDVDAYVNPTSSRVLEFDPAKVIQSVPPPAKK